MSPFVISESIAGSELKVACTSSGADELLWLKDGKPLINGIDDVSVRQFDDVVILQIKRLEPYHSGNFTCLARSSEGSSSFSSVLTVTAPPKWVRVPDEKVMISSDATKLSCEASGYPVPEITWLRNGGWCPIGLIESSAYFSISNQDGF